MQVVRRGRAGAFHDQTFDRTPEGQKRHFASLFGMAHMPYSAPGSHSHSYEDYFEAIEELDLATEFRHEAFRRMVFNVLSCNMDDHTKNFGFILSPNERWELAPAFDITYANNPQPGRWTSAQQMSVMGKRMDITMDDLISIGHHCRIATRPKLQSLIEPVIAPLKKWSEYADEAGVSQQTMEKIQSAVESRLSESMLKT